MTEVEIVVGVIDLGDITLIRSAPGLGMSEGGILIQTQTIIISDPYVCKN